MGKVVRDSIDGQILLLLLLLVLVLLSTTTTGTTGTTGVVLIFGIRFMLLVIVVSRGALSKRSTIVRCRIHRSVCGYRSTSAERTAI
uniref:Putative secreted peptide n=1 Tax=Anopheles braziliensis TaxID=58242 RepID=A0A2M3ZPF9_9DIPT